MSSATKARAGKRELVSAAVIGSGIALTFGALIMTAGVARVAVDHDRVDETTFSEVADSAGALLSGPSAQRAAVRLAAKKPSELDCLTHAVYYEARGESKLGQQAVAQVVLNRSRNRNFPRSVCAVVFQRAKGVCQFSFACDGSMRRAREPAAWAEARRVAARALSGFVLRDIGGATHFHTVNVSPAWGPRMLRVTQVGLHVFYRFNPRPPAATEASQDVLFTADTAEATQLRLTSAMLSPAESAAAPAEAGKDAQAQPTGENAEAAADSAL